ncbi:MAG: DUF5615 family PIN-like protein [Candidatus Heimdallarchaeota archaeon]
MKFLIDKALSPRTVVYLIESGYNAVRADTVTPGTVVEDETIFNYAIENGYYIITTVLGLERF